MEHRQKILIVDDSEMNRAILSDMLESEYDLVEAEDGVQAVRILQEQGTGISLVLLDIVMPRMNGFDVLAAMNANRWIEDIPVIMISAENGSTHIERAYQMGVTDFISRPFDALIVHRRVVNTIMLYAKQKKLVNMVADQIYEKERRSALMIDILSHIVEFRNGESGLHVLHVRTITELLLNHLAQKTDRYDLTPFTISMISTASALHDIGKISVDEKILNKAGKLTDEEFSIMKSHAKAGADMLEGLAIHQDEPLVKAACEICRWHHERYDGRGYPDGLKGDEIPIAAQIVALADVYDALTSERCYKKAFPHETAVQMICDGQCGAFNPLVLECLTEVSDKLRDEIAADDPNRQNLREIQSIIQEMSRHEELTASERTLHLLEHERMKYSFFAAMSQEIQFEYTVSPPMITLNAWGASRLGLDEVIMEPRKNNALGEILPLEMWEDIARELRATTPDKPMVSHDCKLCVNGEPRWFRIVSRALWSVNDPPQYTGAIGKATDIHDAHTQLSTLERMAAHDTLTGLLNHASAKRRIMERLSSQPDGGYALAIFDLDHFKSANDNYGHIFGDHVLSYVAECVRDSIRGDDIAARVGGDEFLIFLEYKEHLAPILERIFTSISGRVYEGFPISLSMGVARVDVMNIDYDTLFHRADQALYTVKQAGRGQWRFYDSSMARMLSVISPIDGREQAGNEKTEKGRDEE